MVGVSVDTVRREMQALQRKGLIGRESGKARAITVRPDPRPTSQPVATEAVVREGRGPRRFTPAPNPSVPATGWRATRPADVRTLLRAQREQLGITQRGLAAELGYHHSAVTYWESGSRAMTVDRLFDLLDTLRVDVVLVPRDGAGC